MRSPMVSGMKAFRPNDTVRRNLVPPVLFRHSAPQVLYCQPVDTETESGKGVDLVVANGTRGDSVAAWIEITRIRNNVVPVSAFAFLSAYLLRPSDVAVWITSPPFWAAFAATHCITYASMIINDLFDQDIDAINHPSRPLVRGAIAPREAAVAALGFYGLSAVLSLRFLPAVLDPLWMTSIFITSSYTLVWKRIPLVKNVACALVVAATVPFMGLSTLSPDQWSTLSPLAIAWGILTTKIAFVTSLYIEILLDMVDREGDRQHGIMTLPNLFGNRATLWNLAGTLWVFQAFLMQQATQIHSWWMCLNILGLFSQFYFQLAKLSQEESNTGALTKTSLHRASRATTVGVLQYLLFYFFSTLT